MLVMLIFRTMKQKFKKILINKHNVSKRKYAKNDHKRENSNSLNL